MELPFKIAASYYASHMLEAVHAVDLSNKWRAEGKRLQAEEGTSEACEARVTAGVMARHAFLCACLATESAANALLQQAPGVSKQLYRDLEKISTLNKFELFALLKGTPLDRGDDAYGKMKEVWRLRNAFFHPKETWGETVEDKPGVIKEQEVGKRRYPTALDFLR